MSNAAREDGSHPTILAQELSFLPSHEQLSQQVVAEEAGYFYIYLSNESNTGSEAFFDDFSIQVSESFIVQQIDYYPYGMIARNYARTTDKQTKDLFQGKTYEDLTKWYDFHARQYDASLGRWFGVDPKAGVMPYNSPYSAMMNNPVMFTDPDGELPILIPMAIGAIAGGITGHKLGKANGATGWKMFGYIAGGSVVGGLSGMAGFGIAGSGAAFSNTLAIGVSSSLFSTGMNLISGGSSPVVSSFGAFSINWSDNSIGYLGKKGNSGWENFGYAMGALANLNDINNLIDASKATLYTQESYADGSKDLISHTGIIDDSSNKSLMSFGPNDNKIGTGGLKDQIGSAKSAIGGHYKKFAIAIRRGTSEYPVPINLSKSIELSVNKHLFAGLRGFSKVLPYQGATVNCVNVSSLGLWLNGIPNFGIHPYLLHYSIVAYNNGFRPDIFGHFFQFRR
jgi:RHS repeat-associated protein